MIDYTVTLTPSGGVVLPGHASALALGYTKNRGVYRLHIDATGEWEGLTIRAFWHVPDGKDPVSSLVADGSVAVPASVTAQPGNGCVTFEGSDGTRTVTSADLRYRVAANSGTEDGTDPEPGTPAWQELVGAVHTDATAAEQAKTDAQTAAKQAGASVKKAGQALSDTITAKEDALKAIGDKQTTATQAVDTARDKALQQVEASTEAAQTAASEAATSAGNADQSAQEAAGSLQELKDGIANGNFKGEPGNDGKSPVVTVTDIKNGHRVSITDKDGTKTIDVLNGQAGKDGTQIDDATVGLDAWSSKHIIDTLCPPISETGNPAQFCPVAGYPLGCKVSWEPTQEGAGDPSPDNIRPISGRDAVKVERCGENLLDEARFPISKTKNHLMITSKMTLPAGTYTVCILSVANGVYANGADVDHTYDSNKHTFTLARPTAVQLKAYWINERPEKDEKIWIVEGNEWRAYTHYTGQTATLTLPRTIYGGTVDAVTGDGQETWDLLTLTGTERIYKRDRFDLFEINLVLPVSVPTSTVVASHWSGTKTANTNALYAENRNVNVGLHTCGFDTVDDLKSYLAAQYAAGTPVQIAYKMATPEPFTATGVQPIPALPGVNTLMTDADSVTVTGRADPIKRIIDLEDAVASMTNT